MSIYPEQVVFFWFRRDLRLHDNTGLFHALSSGYKVVPLFIFDTEILENLEDKADKRVEFIHSTLLDLQHELQQIGSELLVRHGSPVEVWKKIIEEFSVVQVIANEDYEPYAQSRDNAVKHLLAEFEIGFTKYKDHVIFEKNEVLTDTGKPYTVFTPYSKKWRLLATKEQFSSKKSLEFLNNFWQPTKSWVIPSLSEIGFTSTNTTFPSKEISLEIINNYDKTRDIPANLRGTSRLSLHLRFGTISIRECAHIAASHNQTWLNELIWRDFYQQILWNFPHAASRAFKPQYDSIPWRTSQEDFDRWCAGQTGYPIVDAGMRELNETGFMHNRVRMITASFLTKHLLLDWKLGEAYFAKKLLDFDLAANNGGWQWAAGSGCDAAPYFRIFNPQAQTDKFDPDFEYIRRWVPEFQTPNYVKPIIEHKFARERCLEVYKHALNQNEQ